MNAPVKKSIIASKKIKKLRSKHSRRRLTLHKKKQRKEKSTYIHKVNKLKVFLVVFLGWSASCVLDRIIDRFFPYQ
jgi:hypothetical protein